MELLGALSISTSSPSIATYDPAFDGNQTAVSKTQKRTYDRDVVSVLLEALGNVRSDEAGPAADADLGTLSGGAM